MICPSCNTETGSNSSVLSALRSQYNDWRLCRGNARRAKRPF